MANIAPTRRIGLVVVCAGIAVAVSGCSSPGATAPTAAAATAVPPTTVPVATPQLRPTPPLVPTPPTTAPGATVVVPTPAAAGATQPTVGPTPGVASVARAMGELPAAPGAIAVVETANQVQDPGLVTPMEIQFELAQPIGAADTLRTLVDNVQSVAGVVRVKSDGVHMLVQYDTARVQPTQLRQRLTELGHAAAPGTDVPAPGGARD